MATDFTNLSSKEVERLHKNADTDGSAKSMHHTLGPGINQSSPGGHTHRGGDSALLLEGTSISGSRGSGAALQSVIAALVELGASDNTTT